MLLDQKYMIGNAAKNQIIVSQPCSIRMNRGSPCMAALSDFIMFMLHYISFILLGLLICLLLNQIV